MISKGVLWDMDGVLIDTGEFHYLAWSQTLTEYNIPFSRQLFQATFGMNNAGTLFTLLGQEPSAELYSAITHCKEERFRCIIHGQAQLLPGVIETLRLLRAKGFRQAIASSAPPANIDLMADELNLRGYFDAIVSGYDLPGKPEPDVFLAAARLIEVAPQDCIVIEDSVSGVEGAKRAGMKCIAVTTTNPADKLRRADCSVANLLQLEPTAFDDLLGRSSV